MQNYRPQPHIAIPHDAHRPPPNVEAYSSYPFEVDSASSRLPDPWNVATPTPGEPTNRFYVLPHTRARTRSALEPVPPNLGLQVPDPQLHRSVSQRQTAHEYYHRSSRSDSGHPYGEEYSSGSGVTSPFSSSVNLPADEMDFKLGLLTRELSHMTLHSEEGLRQFQNGELAENDEEWHRLVPLEAREALGKREVERQSVLFEIFKSERDYVADLKLIKEVFVEPLASASPPIISDTNRQQNFMSTVFWNLDQICICHERMLVALFERQQEQHPLVQSVADIILESAFEFQADYESYIKHYPLAEQRHRTELKYNKRYQEFMQRCSQDPRVKKRDLITFLSRPVTRLPRLNLMLQHLQKLADANHPDAEDLPVILSILNDFLKSTQPGIEAAENKVKFWDLCESLVFNKGELIELDYYSDTRSLIYAGSLARRSKSEMDWNPWYDLYVALLDNFFLITKEEKRGGVTKRLVVSRPIPLEYLRLGNFDDPPDTRKERVDEGGILDSLRGAYRSIYPFTVYHAVEKFTRRYTLYAPSESIRKKWYDALVDAKGVDDVRREANQWFMSQVVEDGAFRVPGNRMARHATLKRPPSGRVIQAASFVASGGKAFMAVCCSTGIFVGRRGENYRKILSYEDVKSIIVLQDFNKIIFHHDTYLLCYSLEVLARVFQYQSPPSSLDASLETVAGQAGNVLCCQAGQMGDRTIVVYAIKNFIQVTVHVVEACHPSEFRMASPRATQTGFLSFRPYGEPLYVPKDVFAVMPLAKTIAICTERGIVIANPSSSSTSVIAVVPDFGSASHNSELKARCETAKALGLVRHDAAELMVIYDTMGCYITKYGQPTRDSAFIRWEIKATSFVHRPPNILLFSSEFIEIRDTQTGLLKQVIEAVDIRLLIQAPLSLGPLFVGMRGRKDDEDGLSHRIVELVETAEITSKTPIAGPFKAAEGMWDEWDSM
ncbi:hypothetical protein J3R82DRAFT_11404 [Butyriboletus roseoflavus]|nr:hypothetical protein J3R82DRAFT_11404 [Butyriboletus roseoflavus]